MTHDRSRSGDSRDVCKDARVSGCSWCDQHGVCDPPNCPMRSTSLRIAYADPPYPGLAHLYPENTEVDHVELIAQLCGYDGWALSADERSLAYVLGLCPPGVRVLSWCKSDAMPCRPNPWASWEPVICQPARTAGATCRSYYVGPAPPRGFAAKGRQWLVGAKTPAFCEWLFRCLGADPSDTLTDFFPGSGVVGETWERWRRQPPLFIGGQESFGGAFNKLRRRHPQLPGMPEPVVRQERRDVA